MKRTLFSAAVVVVGAWAISQPLPAAEVPPAAPETTIWLAHPAKNFTESSPLGNGRLGAMMFGGTDQEWLQLNEDTLWGGGPYDQNNPEALAALPEARRLVFEGKYDAASELISSKVADASTNCRRGMRS